MDESQIAEGATRGFIKGIFDGVSGLFSKKKKIPLTDEDLKKNTQVVFVDDEPFEYISLIRDAGWNAIQVSDVTDLDDVRIRLADIIFLDYKGVGKVLSPSHEGIGLLKALKQKYPNKPVIFYSAHAGFSLSDEFSAADDWLAKNADPVVYIQKIEEFARAAREE